MSDGVGRVPFFVSNNYFGSHLREKNPKNGAAAAAAVAKQCIPHYSEFRLSTKETGRSAAGRYLTDTFTSTREKT